MKFCYNTSFTFLNNPKDLDPSYKMDLDFRIVLEGEKLCLIIEEIQELFWVITHMKRNQNSKSKWHHIYFVHEKYFLTRIILLNNLNFQDLP